MKATQPVALVTGASRGIGRAIALQLGWDGYDVGFCYRSSTEAAAEVEAELRALGRRVLCERCDVSDFEAVQRFVERVEKELGPLGLVVNCAGIARDNPLVLMDAKGWKDVLAANLDGIFNVCRSAVFGFMKRKRGCIINISSVAGVYGNPTQTNYSASKAGVIGFSRALAKEVGTYGVRVNVVAPGFIVTEMTSALTPRVSERMMSSIPLKRFGATQEVADLVSFLASEKAAYITGQTIHVDGGIVL
ncbi:MAG TPA: 3-oxoacyl-[acyl-carrier-protein] reductase [Vicinamibacteria bacterium]|jgi:3-oxoacyl-[acyl-carrier protein] reductase